MLIDQFYPVLGGAEQQAFRISLKLVQRGYSVTVLTRSTRKGMPTVQESGKIDIWRLPIAGYSGSSKLKSTIPAVKWLIENKDRYDIIHCHGINPLEWSALLAGYVTRKPYVVKIPLSNFLNYAGAKTGFAMKMKDGGRLSKVIRPLFHPALKFVRTKLIKKASRVIAISPEINATLNGRGFNHVLYIPNGIDIDEFRPVTEAEKLKVRGKLRLPVGTVLCVYSGRLAVEKNINSLLFAWEDYSRRPDAPPSRLIILGDGRGQTYSVEEESKKLVHDRNMKNVFFLGSVRNVKEYLQAGDVFVLPSLWEGMSNSLLEAMACAIPAIASDIPGNQALIEDDISGLLFDPINRNQLTDCLLNLAKDGRKRVAMGQKARERAVNHFSLDGVTEAVVREYENILADNP